MDIISAAIFILILIDAALVGAIAWEVVRPRWESRR